MTVAELIAKLQKAPPAANVLFAGDDGEFWSDLTTVTVLRKPFRLMGWEIVMLWASERPPTDSGEEIL